MKRDKFVMEKQQKTENQIIKSVDKKKNKTKQNKHN